MSAMPAEDDRLTESRRLVEARLVDVREALHEDLGIVARSRAWVLPVIGFAVGFSLAVGALRRRRSLR